MGCHLTFFSFVTLGTDDREAHRRYDEWHRLDHLPENLALPGVAHGQRWARTEDCRAASTGTTEHEDTDYVAMYWFREPVRAAVAEWEQLGTDSFQWGRGPLLTGVRRTLLGFFRPVKGYVAPSALVSLEALKYRPHQGLALTLSRYAEPLGPDTHAHHAWEDRVLVPALLDVPGVAGAWTFALSRAQQPGLLPAAGDQVPTPGSLRIRLLYLDGEPRATYDEIRAVVSSAVPDGTAEVLLSTPLRTITPWQDW